MTSVPTITLRNVELEGRGGFDVRLEGGFIAEVGRRLPKSALELDGRGGAIIPGLIDHHIHLLGAAAQLDSLRVETVLNARVFAARLAVALSSRPAGEWLRVTGYHEVMAGELGREMLDALAPRHPVRVQHQSGALWILNSAGLAKVVDGDPPPCVELDRRRRPTGRIWRGDAWLGSRIPREPPRLAPIGRRLAACGVTAVSDASATTDAEAAALIAAARRTGDLPQRVALMSGGKLQPPLAGVGVGPVKIVLDEHALPDLDELTHHIALARSWRRKVAVHCVTAGELALTLAAFDQAGAAAGDRIEHGSLIPEAAIEVILRLGLTVVTQPCFTFDRGDRHLAHVDVHEHQDLYRCASLLSAGIPVAASSDAPYGDIDPWVGIRAAVERRTRNGLAVAEAESVTPEIALSLYLGDLDRPGGGARRVARGGQADLCVLGVGFRDALNELNAAAVAATIIQGRIVFESNSATCW